MSQESMNATIIKSRGGSENFIAARVPKPKAPTGHEMLVRVKACSVNPIDIKVRSGVYDDFPHYYSMVPPEGKDTQDDYQILGYDGAGVVEAIGADVPSSAFAQGDEVFFVGSPIRQGINAEYVLIDCRGAARKPKNITFAQAAAMPLTYITAYEALIERLGIQREENAGLLVVNGAGGVGAVACQIARKLLRLPVVVATASREETRKFATDMGATHVVDHHEDVAEQVKALGLSVPIKYVFITHTTELYLAPAAAVCAPFGKVCSIVQSKKMGDMYGTEFMAKSLTFVWCLLGTKPVYGANVEANVKIMNDLKAYMEDGTIKSHLQVKEQLSLAGLRKAHEVVEGGKSVGKVVCTVEVNDDKTNVFQ